MSVSIQLGTVSGIHNNVKYIIRNENEMGEIRWMHPKNKRTRENLFGTQMT